MKSAFALALLLASTASAQTDNSVKKAQPLRPTSALGGETQKLDQPLEYEPLREDDALFRHKVWRELDTREKFNQIFRAEGDGNQSSPNDVGDSRLYTIIYDAILNGRVIAFDAKDDRFTTPLTIEQVKQLVTGGTETVQIYRLDGTIEKEVEIAKEFDPNSIERFRIKEEYIFDRKTSRMHIRILGIAPVRQVQVNGKVIGDQVLFWVHFPDLRPSLVEVEVYNPKNMGGARETWDDVFLSHRFHGRIIKSTIDNFRDASFKQFISDPLFRLLESDNQQNRIRDYEQDRWQY